MSEIKQAGYQDLRDYIQNNWTYIELRDNNGLAVVRLPISDPRVSWTHLPGSQTLELTVIVKGSDPDILVPQTFAGTAIYKVANEGVPMSEETFVPFTIMSEDDELTIRHQIEVPEVV
jgi:hypothetical protein